MPADTHPGAVRFRSLFLRWLVAGAAATAGLLAYLWLAPGPVNRAAAITATVAVQATLVMCVSYAFAAFAKPPPDPERPLDAKGLWRLAMRTLAGAAWFGLLTRAEALGAFAARHPDEAWFAGSALIDLAVLIAMAAWGAAATLRARARPY